MKKSNKEELNNMLIIIIVWIIIITLLTLSVIYWTPWLACIFVGLMFLKNMSS